jgi:hypothetical protein
VQTWTTSPFWQLPKAVGPSQQRIDRMTEALVWLRRSENSFVIFGDSDRAERYVQFAVDATGSEKMASVATVAVAVPLLVAAGIASPDENIGSVVPVTADRPPWWAAGGGYFGEPDHEPLLMEVGSGLWPGSSSRGLADDETVVAKLAAHGLRLGGGRHTCLNFCRDGITEPRDILASLTEEIMVDIVHARPRYRLTIKRGNFR